MRQLLLPITECALELYYDRKVFWPGIFSPGDIVSGSGLCLDIRC